MSTPAGFSKRMLIRARSAERGSIRRHQIAHRAAVDFLVDNTPVDTGLARSGWYGSVGEAPVDQTFNVRSPSEVKAGAKAAVSKLKADETSYVSNRVDYITDLLVFGTSTQTPAGTAKQALQEAAVAIRNVILLGK